jgi:glycosyltransferase involved in cell wall biosynthesis
MQYHHTRFVGGAETQAWLLAGEFKQRGWDVHYVSATEIPRLERSVEEITLHSLPDALSAWTGERTALHVLLKTLQPDVIYTRTFEPYTLCGVLAAPSSALTIWAAGSRHDGKPWPYLHMAWRYESPWNFLKRAPRHLYYNSIARRGRKQSKLVLCQTAEQQADLAKLRIQAILVRNVHTWVDQTYVQNHQGRPVVLWADSIKRLKRPEKFLELARRCADLDAEFLMIGRIYDLEYEAQIKQTAQQAPNFRYGGAIPAAQVEDYFRRAHLHVKTSLPIEGFPNTYVQSWLYGVPVAALDVDPDGLLVKHDMGRVARTSSELEQTVRELMTNSALRRELGAHARAFATHEFDLATNVTRMLTLIEAHR